MRKVLIRIVLPLAGFLLVAAGIDFGFAIRAEIYLTHSLRVANRLSFDPWVGILGFPFLTQSHSGHYRQVEIKAGAIDHPVLGRVSIESTLFDLHTDPPNWLIPPDAVVHAARAESRMMLDSTHLGRYLGMTDLLVEAPLNDDMNDLTESGISDRHGLVFTGTPVKAGFTKQVSVAVDLSMPNATTVVMTPTAILTAPGTARQAVPADKQAAVLAAFRATVPGLRLPFGLEPITIGARGSDVIIEGITTGLTTPLSGFKQS